MQYDGAGDQRLGGGQGRRPLGVRRSSAVVARLWLLLAMALGCAFVAIKLVEYAGEIGGGIGLETSVFFTLYFLLTGFHLLQSVSAW